MADDIFKEWDIRFNSPDSEFLQGFDPFWQLLP